MPSEFPTPFAGRHKAAPIDSGTRHFISSQTGTVRSDRSQLSQNGDAFVFLDLPPGAQVGCDTLAGTTNKEPADSVESGVTNKQETTVFCGFRDIPPGAHFAWISAPGAMSRQGCWFITQRPSTASQPSSHAVVRTKKWDRFHEVLVDFKYPEQGTSATGDLAAVFSQLIPYSTGSDQAVLATQYPGLDHHGGVNNNAELWRLLTSCITVPVLCRIAGSDTTTSTPDEWVFATTDTSKDEVVMLGGAHHTSPRTGTGPSKDYSEFCFLFAKDDLDAYRLLAQEKRKDGKDKASYVEQDLDSTDTTERILILLEHPQSKLAESDFIGELQFAFLTGIVLSNLSCLEQWWHFVLRVFLRARQLVARRPSLCRSILETLYAQLTYLERFTTGKIPRLSARNGWSSEANDGDSNQSGTSIFDAKPQGAVRLRASLAVFRQQFKFSNNDSKTDRNDAQVDEKSILSTSFAEASASEAFMNLEALLWKYGWDLTGSGDRDNDGRAAGKRNDYSEDNDDDELDIYDTPLKEGAQEGTRHAKTHTNLSDSDDDDDDYQPVIVEMDENGNEVGLVSWD